MPSSDGSGEPRTRPIGVVLGGQHPLTLCGLSQVFEKEGDFAVLAVCTHVDSLFDAIRQHQPDMVILDLDRNGTFKVLRSLQRKALSTRTVVLASAADHKDMIDAVRIGARAVLQKELGADEFVACIRRVHEGHALLNGENADRLPTKLFKSQASLRRAGRELTPRETEIARLAVLGVSTRDIADRLAVKQGTVKIHLHSIYDKLNVGGRLGLILFARRHGLA